jgi:hypothetical protein
LEAASHPAQPADRAQSFSTNDDNIENYIVNNIQQG